MTAHLESIPHTQLTTVTGGLQNTPQAPTGEPPRNKMWQPNLDQRIKDNDPHGPVRPERLGPPNLRPGNSPAWG